MKKVRTFKIRGDCHVFVFSRDVSGNADATCIAGPVLSHGQVGGECSGGHAGSGGQSIEQRCLQCQATLLGISRARKGQHRCKTVVAVKASGTVHNVEGRASEQTAADQDDETDAELKAKQDTAAMLVASASGNGRTAFVQ